VLVGVGLAPRRRASGGVEAYFVSGRSLPWWIAGTSMIAASFASDTPLLVSGLVRSRGLWGNWMWWGLGISAVLTVFLFAPLWRSARVLTDVELSELRYSGRRAAALRGVKALYWGVLYNCYAAGAWSVSGLAKVASATTGMERDLAIWICAVLGTAYAAASGLWGLVLTDMLQFGLAVVGGLLVAWYAVEAAGGLDATLAALSPEQAELLPLSGPGLEFVLPFLLIQWWAWKNTDGSGILVQRMAACRDEREAVRASLWYVLVHYGLRAWPWILVGAASLVLVPLESLPRLASGAPDHESAYPILLTTVLPAGLRGLVVAWFFAEFMSAVAQAMNWGSSLVVNDLYRRFVHPEASERRCVAVGRIASVAIMGGAVATAFLSDDIAAAFVYVISGTAAVGVVAALRWLWWRLNAWSEVVAMALSPLMTFLLAEPLLGLLGVEPTPVTRTLAIVLGAAGPAVLASLLTAPDEPEHLRAFYRRVRPPALGWGPVARACPEVVPRLSFRRVALLWLLGLGLVYGVLFGIGGLVLGRGYGPAALAVALACAAALLRCAGSTAGRETPGPDGAGTAGAG
jgi:solute:Na+ symporter, SSS family